MRFLIPILAGLFLLSIGWHCSAEKKVEQVFRNLEDGVEYVGMQTCQSCHQNIHDSYIHTGMGQSFDKASAQKTAARFGDHALVYDDALDFYYFPFFRDSNMYVLEFRLEDGDTTHQRIEQIDYIIGSGHHTNSHLIEQNGYFYQAPITYYTQEERWDMAPGYDQGANLRFSRYLTSECITCHNHFPEPFEGSLNKYEYMPTGIECERCHGPGEIHVREKLAGDIIDTSLYTDYSIVNPKKLPRDLQMDLCQRCHLQGLAVLEEGKTFYDFKPGMALNEVMNVYLPRYTDSHERFIMASQADRLRMSACYQESELTCITCHNPHQSVRQVDQTKQFNQACKTCHQSADQSICTVASAEKENCVDCHMPPSSSIDIPHINITDHYISKENIRGNAKTTRTSGQAQFLGLQALTKDNPTTLDMAKAYLALYEKFVESAIMLDSAYTYLQQLDPSKKEVFPSWVRYHYLKGNFGALVGRAQPEGTLDGWTAYRLGEAFYQQSLPTEALNYFQQATTDQPLNLDFLEKRGLAEALLKQKEAAKVSFRKVLNENPNRAIAHCNLGYILATEGHFETANYHYDRALALDPDYPQALLNKAALLMQSNQTDQAEILIERAQKLADRQNRADSSIR